MSCKEICRRALQAEKEMCKGPVAGLSMEWERPVHQRMCVSRDNGTGGCKHQQGPSVEEVGDLKVVMKGSHWSHGQLKKPHSVSSIFIFPGHNLEPGTQQALLDICRMKEQF